MLAAVSVMLAVFLVAFVFRVTRNSPKTDLIRAPYFLGSFRNVIKCSKTL